MIENEYLAHYGIKGQKWGVRNYENYDGTLTSEGKKRYYGSNKTDSESSTIEKAKDIKDRIMRNPSPAEVYKNRNLFSDAEIKRLCERLTNEAKIRNLDNRSKNKISNKLKDAFVNAVTNTISSRSSMIVKLLVDTVKNADNKENDNT